MEPYQHEDDTQRLTLTFKGITQTLQCKKKTRSRRVTAIFGGVMCHKLKVG